MADVIKFTTMVDFAIADHQPKNHFSSHQKTRFSSPSSPAATSLPVVSPDYTGLILNATETRSLAVAKSIHAAIVKSVAQPNVFLHNHILNMYCKCQSTHNAHKLFDEIPEPNIISHNILITSYAKSGLPHRATTIFHHMLSTDLQPDFYTFSALISTCAGLADRGYGPSLHAYAIKSNCDQHVSVATALISMYSEFGFESSAVIFFEHLMELDLVNYNAMIAGSVRNGDFAGALTILTKMKNLGIYPDQVTFLSSLKAASGDGFLSSGSQIHAQIVKTGFETNIPISSALINMYANHGSIDDAYRSFLQLQPSNNLIHWTAIISGFNQNKNEAMAIALFRKMQAAGIEPDQLTYANIIQACTGIRRIRDGKETHARVVRAGLFSDASIGNLLIPFYSKCGRPEDGFVVFDQIENRNNQSWSQLILLCLQNQSHQKGFKIFLEMIDEGFEPEHLTVITIIQICTYLPEVETGQQLHGYLIKKGFLSEIEVATVLVTLYSRHGMIEVAHKIFRTIPEPDTILWTALIAAYEESGNGKSALELFRQMIREVTPDTFTLPSVISSCAGLADLAQGRAIHGYAIRNNQSSNLLIGNALISLYSECQQVKLATVVFDQMPNKDAASWATMIAGCTQNGQPEEIQTLFTQMLKQQVKPDEFVISAMLNACSSLTALDSGRSLHALALQQGFDSSIPLCNSLITMYSRCGEIDEAYLIFKEMGIRNLVSWNTMLTGLAQNGQSREALQLFEEMQQRRIWPNATTFIAVLSACSHQGLVREGEWYFELMRYGYSINPTMDHYCCMIDLFSRAGELDQAHTLIGEMPSPNVSAWMAFLSGCRIYKKMDLGKIAAERLISMKPDESSAYVLLANIYAEAKQWELVREVRETMRLLEMKKEPGCSWIEINRKIHVFTVKDNSHTTAYEIYRVLEGLHKQIKVG